MSIAIQSSDELEQLRARLRKMSDDDLVRFGKAARSLCRGPRLPGHVQAAVGRGSCGVAAQASKGAVISALLPDWQSVTFGIVCDVAWVQSSDLCAPAFFTVL